jgi:hypothetical protein
MSEIRRVPEGSGREGCAPVESDETKTRTTVSEPKIRNVVAHSCHRARAI